MSLNKWKPWPMENSEDMLKIDQKLVTKKIGSYDHFLAKIFFSNLVKLKMYPEYVSSCWPIHIPSTRSINWCEQQKYGKEQGGNQHMQT